MEAHPGCMTSCNARTKWSKQESGVRERERESIKREREREHRERESIKREREREKQREERKGERHSLADPHGRHNRYGNMGMSLSSQPAHLRARVEETSSLQCVARRRFLFLSHCKQQESKKEQARARGARARGAMAREAMARGSKSDGRGRCHTAFPPSHMCFHHG